MHNSKLRILPGVALAMVLWRLSFPDLSPEAHRLLAIMALVVCFWVLEALPLWKAALLGCALSLAAGALSAETLLRSFTDPILFLFIGSFLLAKAMHRHGLDNRAAHALITHPWVGGNSHRTLWALALVAWGLAMWLSITATVAMLLPPALILARTVGKSDRRYAAAILLMLPYAASAGAMASPVGTPPNLIGMAFMKDILGEKITFLQWMAVGMPLAAAVLAVRYAAVVFMLHPPAQSATSPAQNLKDIFRPPGNWSRAERVSFVCFGATALLWIIGFPPAPAAMTFAVILFLLPAGLPSGERILRWKDVLTVDWGTIVLFAGGIALGRAVFDTGLGAFLGGAWLGPLSAGNFNTLVLSAILTTVLFSTLASNTAAANVVIPLVLSAAGPDPAAGISLVFAVTFAASLGVTLPVSTPANAMIYGSQMIRLRDMIRIGLLVDFICIPIVWAATKLLPIILR